MYFPFHMLSPIRSKKSYTSFLLQKKPKCIRFGHMYIINNVSSDLFFKIDCKFSENLITIVEIGKLERGKKILREKKIMKAALLDFFVL